MKKQINPRIDLKELFKEFISLYVRKIYIWPKEYKEFMDIYEINRSIHWLDYHDEPFFQKNKEWWFKSEEGTWRTLSGMKFIYWLFLLKSLVEYYLIVPVKRLLIIAKYFFKGYSVDWFGWGVFDEEKY